MNKLNLSILLCCHILTACSMLVSPRDEYSEVKMEPAVANELLFQAESCCATLSELTYIPIKEETELFVPLSSLSQVFSFAEGKSFVQAYRLDSYFSKVKLTMNSRIYDSVAVPNLMLLDSEFNVTRIITYEKFIYKEAGMFRGDRLVADITIFRPQADNPKNETYLVFYTDSKTLSGGTTIVHPAKAYAKRQNVDVPNIPDPIIPHSPVGLIKLELEIDGTVSDSTEAYIPLDNSPEKAASSSEVNSEGETLETNKKSQPLDFEIEQAYNTAIKQAVAAQELDKALTIVDEAEAAGSKTARSTFVDALKKE